MSLVRFRPNVVRPIAVVPFVNLNRDHDLQELSTNFFLCKQTEKNYRAINRGLNRSFYATALKSHENQIYESRKDF
jgi:hypothetical protein